MASHHQSSGLSECEQYLPNINTLFLHRPSYVLDWFFIADAAFFHFYAEISYWCQRQNITHQFSSFSEYDLSLKLLGETFVSSGIVPARTDGPFVIDPAGFCAETSS
jgi:hypothetical protein